MTPVRTAPAGVFPLTGAASDFDPLLERVADASVVLIGEASHGTHEFYQLRGEITKRLIREKDFVAVAVEADWPDAWRVNRYVRGQGRDRDAVESLASFRRFPAWMWRNADVLDFVGWLRQQNDTRKGGEPKAGFYGLDLYSLFASIESVLAYLDRIDPAAAKRARTRYACFDHFGGDAETYGHAATLELTPSCESAVVEQLLELRRTPAQEAAGDPDAQFDAEQNARLVKNAERYYRSMFQGRVESWNARDRHMAETLVALRAHLAARTGGSKVVVWAHNSHLGDARKTEMGVHGELNLGQLVREEHGSDAVLVGFTTWQGTVTAATDWGGPAERRRVRPALAGSHEARLHELALERGLDPSERNFLVLTQEARDGGVPAWLDEGPRLERAIGVIYRPETERTSHYFQADLARQFDAVIHVDETRAVEPLEWTAGWDRGHPDTFPTGI